MDEAVRRGVLAIAAVILSLVLAIASLLLSTLVPIYTPGVLAVQLPVARGHYFSRPDLAIVMEVGIDWVFWFAVLCLAYFLVRKFSRRSKEPR